LAWKTYEEQNHLCKVCNITYLYRAPWSYASLQDVTKTKLCHYTTWDGKIAHFKSLMMTEVVWYNIYWIRLEIYVYTSKESILSLGVYPLHQRVLNEDKP